MKTKTTQRLYAVLVVLLVALATSNAQFIGKRFVPKDTFKGNPATLTAIGHSNPAIASYYQRKFGAGWDQPGALKVIGEPTDIPDNAGVPGNALLFQGKVREMYTHQRGADRAWLVENTLTNMKMWVKSCGQGFSAEMPKGPPPAPALETDFDIYVSAGATASATAEATADAEATAKSSATGGNSSLVFNAPQPLWVPQPRVLATQGSERYQIAGITWVQQVRLTQTQTMSQQQLQEQQQQQMQQQQQQQEQMQQQLQEILNRLGIG